MVATAQEQAGQGTALGKRTFARTRGRGDRNSELRCFAERQLLPELERDAPVDYGDLSR